MKYLAISHADSCNKSYNYIHRCITGLASLANYTGMGQPSTAAKACNMYMNTIHFSYDHNTRLVISGGCGGGGGGGGVRTPLSFGKIAIADWQ